MRTVGRILATTILAVTVLLPSWAAGGDRPYRLRPGDRIRVVVYGHDGLSGERRLDHSGSVSLPLAGSLRLRDMTLRQAEAAIVDALRPDYLKHPRVNVDTLGHRPVYVVGEVADPGRYAYAHGLTVMGAVALAGGYTDDADRQDVRVLRAGTPRGRAETAGGGVALFPGDTVRVPERGLF